jgi:hypothetical protein
MKKLISTFLLAIVAPATAFAQGTVCTAAINPDGTIATTIGSYAHIDKKNTTRSGVGGYIIAFNGPCADVAVEHGGFRTIQRDTRGVASFAPGYCTVQDDGPAGQLFVQCFDPGGNLQNATFTVSVSRF